MTIEGGTFTSNVASAGGAISAASASTVAMNNCTFTANTGYLYGGALRGKKGVDFTVTDCTFDTNESGAGLGGAVYSEDSGTLDVDGSTFVANSATSGGAVYVTAAVTASFSDTDFESNMATDDHGGAIMAEDASPLTITDSRFSANESKSDGGGINAVESDLTVEDAEFENQVGRYGGAIRAYNATSSTTTLRLTNVLFGSNTATGNGGAVSELGYTVEIAYCRFDFNYAATVAGALEIVGSGDFDVHANTWTSNRSPQGGAVWAYAPGGLQRPIGA